MASTQPRPCPQEFQYIKRENQMRLRPRGLLAFSQRVLQDPGRISTLVTAMVSTVMTTTMMMIMIMMTATAQGQKTVFRIMMLTAPRQLHETGQRRGADARAAGAGGGHDQVTAFPFMATQAGDVFAYIPTMFLFHYRACATCVRMLQEVWVVEASHFQHFQHALLAATREHYAATAAAWLARDAVAEYLRKAEVGAVGPPLRLCRVCMQHPVIWGCITSGKG
jgi:hypothetical protein